SEKALTMKKLSCRILFVNSAGMVAAIATPPGNPLANDIDEDFNTFELITLLAIRSSSSFEKKSLRTFLE
ncbi:hypothetical protein, partial [Loigolactobacillus coryniformis]|uniref:hypothetical protein n=1 Tax=Loigolactobacillus coryniformis TaxID=1610 RepID=UPI001F3CBDCA